MRKNVLVISLLAWAGILLYLIVTMNVADVPSGPSPEIGTEGQTPEIVITLGDPDFEPQTEQERMDLVKYQFDQLQKVEDYEWDLYPYYFKDAKGNVPLDTGLKGLGVHIPSRLLTLLDQEKWSVDRCFLTEDQVETVLHVKVKLLPEYSGNLYQDLLTYLKSWESQMLTDTQSVLFHDEVSAGGSPEYTSQFSLVDSRYQRSAHRATVILAETGRTGEIAYVMEGDDIIIGNSVACVNFIAEGLFGPG